MNRFRWQWNDSRDEEPRAHWNVLWCHPSLGDASSLGVQCDTRRVLNTPHMLPLDSHRWSVCHHRWMDVCSGQRQEETLESQAQNKNQYVQWTCGWSSVYSVTSLTRFNKLCVLSWLKTKLNSDSPAYSLAPPSVTGWYWLVPVAYIS